jgi:hypothetical protein
LVFLFIWFVILISLLCSSFFFILTPRSVLFFGAFFVTFLISYFSFAVSFLLPSFRCIFLRVFFFFLSFMVFIRWRFWRFSFPLVLRCFCVCCKRRTFETTSNIVLHITCSVNSWQLKRTHPRLLSPK